jgi:hypothetical protein
VAPPVQERRCDLIQDSVSGRQFRHVTRPFGGVCSPF